MMESLISPVLAAVVAIGTWSFYAVCLQSPRQPAWPKIKQHEAYRQHVTPIKKMCPSLTTFDDFTPVGDKQPVQNVPAFFKSHGNEFSVYTIDWEQESVVLIRPVNGTDLKKDPFFCQAQRQNATEVLVVPIEELQAVADVVSDKVSHVQEVFVFNTARCGSTLLTQAVEASPVAQAASEPLVFDLIFHQILRLRRGSPSPHNAAAVLRDEETAVSLLRNVVSLLNYYLITSDQPHRSVVVYKFMAQPILVADIVFRAFPDAKTVFLYRNGLEVYESWVHVMFKHHIIYTVFKLTIRLGLWKLAPKLPELFRFFGDDPRFSTIRYHGSPVHYLMTLWVGAMQCAVQLQRENPQYFFHAVVHYKALVRRKEGAIRELMEKLAIEWRKDDHGEERIKSAFVEDSQAGAFQSSGRSRPGEKWRPQSSSWMGTWEREYICDVCRKSGNDIVDPDVILPDTMM
ncbi:uncharacterized protein LOC118418485 isoform X1 [Branchiostoma floridae]|uniref:Uncharacterized protein LOC118418485 isoform X1 n=2 Tax=Branchiostoma floridae TaxID=7739 RepID=A0A9J7LE43_BRAFL|nr:uncharacterized protein LOC118418485 isoform X1 [Branchiostoma floridae]XP_035680325.1 uncharacterized protein LOC118418485 isoform X1 [Branchiostoma floridae]